VRHQSGRNFSYDVFNLSRSIATARAPGQAASRSAPQSVGPVSATFPRSAELITMLDEH
jgi:hypothetical protein